MKPTSINNCCTESASTAARRIQDIWKDHEDRTFPTCSSTAYIPCDIFRMFFRVITYNTSPNTDELGQKACDSNITKIPWLFEQIEIIRIDKNVYIYIYIYVYTYIYVSIDIVVYIHMDDCLSTQIYLYMWMYDSFLKCLLVHLLICWLCFSDMLKCFLKAL